MYPNKKVGLTKLQITIFMKKSPSHIHHHKRNSSVTSISATAARNPERIEKLQEFDKWRHEKTSLCFDMVISGIYVHSSHRNRGNFILECTGPSGHWLVEKSFEDFILFIKDLKEAFPVEAGTTGKLRILPKLPLRKCPKWILLKKEIRVWHLVQIERFMRVLLTCSPLVAKSRLMEEFMKSDMLNEIEEQEELSGKSVCISAPTIDSDVLRCHLTNLKCEEEEIFTSIEINS